MKKLLLTLALTLCSAARPRDPGDRVRHGPPGAPGAC